MRILKARARWLRDSKSLEHSKDLYSKSYHDDQRSSMPQPSSYMQPHDALLSEHDPFLTTAFMSTQGDLTGEGFADIFKEMFGPGFSGVF
jgi:hypothetical protein